MSDTMEAHHTSKNNDISNESEKMSEFELSNIFKQAARIDSKHTFVKANTNKTMNRFKNILGNDSSLAKLSMANSYINANWVKFSNQLIADSILAQGPMEHTMNDFYEMCFIEGATDIIMLCEFFESGRNKCAQYFPTQLNESIETAAYKVTCVLLQQNDAYEERLLAVVAKNSPNIEDHFFMRHFWYKQWPDFGTPELDNNQFKCFVDRLLPIFRVQDDRSNEDMLTNILPVVHCSAGVGRSGTLLLSIACIIYAMKVSTVSNEQFKKLFFELREGRANSIQTLDQLKFSYIFQRAFTDKDHQTVAKKNITKSPMTNDKNQADQPISSGFCEYYSDIESE